MTWAYASLAKVGQDSRVILPTDVSSLENYRVHQDFWLFDDTIVVLMNYDSEGRYLGAQMVLDPSVIQEFVAAKQALIASSVPYEAALK